MTCHFGLAAEYLRNFSTCFFFLLTSTDPFIFYDERRCLLDTNFLSDTRFTSEFLFLSVDSLYSVQSGKETSKLLRHLISGKNICSFSWTNFDCRLLVGVSSHRDGARGSSTDSVSKFKSNICKCWGVFSSGEFSIFILISPAFFTGVKGLIKEPAPTSYLF